MNYKELLNLGINDKESRVYLSALELGKSPVQKIAQKAEVKRATTYVIIEALMRKGLMSSITEGKKQYFYAEGPEKLNLLFKSQEEEIKRKQEYLNRIMPELRSLNNTGDKPTVRYFEGKAGMQAMIEEFLTGNGGKESRVVFSADLVKSKFSDGEWEEMRKKRLNKNVKSRAIYNKESGELDGPKNGTQIKVSAKDFPIEAEIAIFGSKIRMATIKNKLSGVIIENDEIARTLKTLFDLAWLGGKK